MVMEFFFGGNSAASNVIGNKLRALDGTDTFLSAFVGVILGLLFVALVSFLECYKGPLSELKIKEQKFKEELKIQEEKYMEKLHLELSACENLFDNSWERLCEEKATVEQQLKKALRESRNLRKLKEQQQKECEKLEKDVADVNQAYVNLNQRLTEEWDEFARETSEAQEKLNQELKELKEENQMLKKQLKTKREPSRERENVEVLDEKEETNSEDFVKVGN